MRLFAFYEGLLPELAFAIPIVGAMYPQDGCAGGIGICPGACLFFAMWLLLGRLIAGIDCGGEDVPDTAFPGFACAAVAVPSCPFAGCDVHLEVGCTASRA